MNDEKISTTAYPLFPLLLLCAAVALFWQPGARAAAAGDLMPDAPLTKAPFYLSPMVSAIIPDGGRDVDFGYGGKLNVGFSLSDEWAIEASLLYDRMNNESSSSRHTRMAGAGVNALLFPFKDMHIYFIGGVAYERTHGAPVSRPVPKTSSNYGGVLVNLGAGYLFGRYHFLGIPFFLRAEGLYRLDAHGANRSGDTTGNGRRSFSDGVLSLGLVFPLGGEPKQPPSEPPPVKMVAAPPPPPPAPPRPPPCQAPGPGQPLNLEGCRAGDVIVLHGVNFETDKATLTGDATALLDRVADGLNNRKDIQVEIDGYTDSRGTARYNLALSQRRTESVKKYLVDHGIEAGRMTTKGFGEANPVASNKTAQGRAENRRVELKIIGGGAGSPVSSSTSSAPPAAAPSAPAPSTGHHPTTGGGAPAGGAPPG